LLGPDAPLTFPCLDSESNFDNHVDMRDFQSLQRTFTGPQ